MTPQQFRSWRREMGWTQTTAAHVLMVTKTSIGAWESGRTPIHGHIEHMASACRVHREIELNEREWRLLFSFKTYKALSDRMHRADMWQGRRKLYAARAGK